MTSNNVTWLCEPNAKLRLTGSREKTSDRANVLFPISLVSLLTGIFHLLLQPLGIQVTFVSQMLAGIALGPSILGHNEKVNNIIFTPKTKLVISVFESFGLIYITFVTSVRADLSIMTKSGRLGIVIGIGSYLLPLIVTSLSAELVNRFDPLDGELGESIQIVTGLESTISFYAILEILTDMKLLNSELGRLALSSSLTNSIMSMTLGTFLVIVSDIQEAGIESMNLLTFMSFIFIIVFIVFILRPVMVWMIRQTPEGKPLKNEHVIALNITVACSYFVSESMGLVGFWGPIVLGVVTPLIAPMGSLLTDKMEAFVWSVFLPCFLINSGKGVNLFSTTFTGFLIVEFLIWVSTTVKLFAIIIPSLYYKIPFMDALSLGLLLNCRGIYDIQTFSRSNRRKMLSDECYGVMVMTSMLKSAIALPLLRAFYDTSRRYVAYKRHTIQHNRYDAELRILACIYEESNVATIINLLGASIILQRPIELSVLNLEEYVGRSLPLVISHRLDKKSSSSKPTKIDIILNAFRQFEQQSTGLLSVQCFTATAPYESMHEDICLMAFEKSTSLVIIPFQKPNSYLIKKIMKNVLKMAPCSVGILFDRGAFMNSRPIFTHRSEINVCVIFIGGPDDREALAYGARMAEDQNVMLTIIRFFAVNHTTKNLMEEKHDLHFISGLRMSTIDNKNVKYIKHSVKEGSNTFYAINSIGNAFELILTGRTHDHCSPVLSGLVEWRENEELGVIGDILASSDFKSDASVMVMQQQASVVEDMVIQSPRFASKHLK